MGGKSKPDNSQVVQQQQQEAAQEAAKEAARQARLTQGLASIKTAFEGAPVMASQTTPFDWSSFNPGRPGVTAASGVPSGYTAVQIPGTTTATTPGAMAVGPSGSGATAAAQLDPTRYNPAVTVGDNTTYGVGGAGRGALPAAPSGATSAASSTWGLRDASGKIYKSGDPLNITSQIDTGQTTGGFDDAFYNKYKQSVLDYYMPQVDKQYSDAKNELTYRLGRSGNIRSSAANTAVADLASQNDINQAGVRNQADTAEGDLRTQVASERAKATSQLYATEDPEVASQQALASVRDISLSQPSLSPLSSLFNIATVGGANVLKGYQGAQTLNTFNNALAKTPAQRVVS